MRRLTSILALVIGGWIATAASSVEIWAGQAQRPASIASPAPQAVLNQDRVTCHNQRLRTAGLALDALDATKPNENAEIVGARHRQAARAVDAAARTATP